MIAIIDYGAGNIASVRNCLRLLNADCVVTANVNEIAKADKILFPGVGQASYAMEQIKAKGLVELIQNCTQPFLGICLGAQLLCDSSEEGETQGLGIFKTKVKRFVQSEELKYPHMGWNNHDLWENVSLTDGISKSEDFYFVHGYKIEPCVDTKATVNYGEQAASILQKNNFYATQFHPEKSGEAGRRLIQNFLKS